MNRGDSASGADRQRFPASSSDDETTFTVATVLGRRVDQNPFRKPPTTDDSLAADRGVMQLRATASLVDSSDDESEAEEGDPMGRRHSASRFNSVYNELAANKHQSLPASFAKRKRTQTAGRSRVETLSSTLKTLAGGISGLSWDEADYRRRKQRPLVDIDINAGVPHIGRSLSLRDEIQPVQDQTQLCSELTRRLKRAEDENLLLRQENKMTGHYKRLLRIAEEATQTDVDAANERAESLSCELEDARRENASVQCELNAVRQVKDEALRQLQDTRAADGDSGLREDSTIRNGEDQKQLEALERKLGLREKELALSKETAERSVIAAETLAKSLDAANEERANKVEEINELRAEVLSLKEDKENLKLQVSHRQNDVEKLEKEVTRLKHDHSIRTRGLAEELQQARGDLASANSHIAETRSIIQAFVKENNALREAKEKYEATLRQLEDDWEQEKLYLRDQNKSSNVDDSSDSIPGTDLDQINTYGAEDLSGDSSSCIHMPAAAPDSSSKQLCFRATPREGTCRVCGRACASGVSVRECQCRNQDCKIWAHTSCLVNRKSVTKSLAFPGTPIPPERVILCRDGSFCK
ncbi:hypothetical protein THAOC_33523 [Thalassiosira oceanica]|uniref:Uncharacterized protein n=1 Tax=Thalassiosira oceanica TaxID=159749 RepID=K0R517_THAOC|nr:hypothetical protein THAOC_33523 [Thalassiosira oceanica]|eukprot:EJK47740.1 hypothetical protein THAOC_33523 [Thalassiosira oceanica]